MNNPQRAFANLLGQTVSECEKGHGSFVIFNLRRESSASSEYEFVCIYMCHWRLFQSGEKVAHSESSDPVISAAVSTLNGKTLLSIGFHQWLTDEGVRHSATFSFDGPMVLKLYQYEPPAEVDSIFSIRSSTGTWRAYRSDGIIEEVIAQQVVTPNEP